MYVEKLRNSIIESTKNVDLEEDLNLGMANSKTVKNLKKFKGMKMPKALSKKQNQGQSRTQSRINLDSDRASSMDIRKN